VQLPCNLAMTEAVTARISASATTSARSSRAADHHGITVVASASLLQGKLAARCPTCSRSAMEAARTDPQRALQFVRSSPGVTTRSSACGGARTSRRTWRSRAAARERRAYVRLFTDERRVAPAFGRIPDGAG
jgi:hypothetical protein